MSETFLNRVCVILARIKDSTSPLDSKVSVADAIEFVNAFIEEFREDLLIDKEGLPIDIATISHEEKCCAYINQLRIFHGDVFTSSRVIPVAEAARRTEQVLVDIEFLNKLGTKEKVGGVVPIAAPKD